MKQDFNIALAEALKLALETKAPKKTGKLIQTAIKKNRIYTNTMTRTSRFKIGNRIAEEKAPHYHILEDAKRIHYPYKGTKQSKGKQDLVKNLRDRDYSGDTYRREPRFKRYIKGKTIIYHDPKQYEEDTYENIHYHYIEKIIGETCRDFAKEHNMKLKIKRRK